MSSSTVAQRIIAGTELFTLVFSIVYLIVGLLGNGLNLTLFLSARSVRRKPCGYIFYLESIVSLSQMAVALASFVLQHGFGVNSITNSTSWCKIKTAAIQSLHFLFVSLICFAAFDQALATHYRYGVRQSSSIQLVRKLIVASLCLMSVHLLLALIFFEVRSPLLACVIYNPIVAKYFICFYYPVLIGLLPIAVALTFSVSAFSNVRRFERRQIPFDRRQLDRQLTAMTLSRVIAWIVLGFPYVIFRIYSVNKPFPTDRSISFAIDFLIGSVTGVLAYGNYVISFYVFFSASTRFRQQIRRMLIKKLTRPSRQLPRGTTRVIYTNELRSESDLSSTLMIRLAL